jgi:hypothetical protein
LASPGIALFAIFAFLTFYMQQVKGYSPLTPGRESD